jgi:hypothetical protein
MPCNRFFARDARFFITQYVFRTLCDRREKPIDRASIRYAHGSMVTFDQIISTKWNGLTHLDAFGHCTMHATDAPSRRTIAYVIPSNVIMQATPYGVRLPTFPDALDTCAERAACMSAYIATSLRRCARGYASRSIWRSVVRPTKPGLQLRFTRCSQLVIFVYRHSTTL